jgi:hypothetical protein
MSHHQRALPPFLTLNSAFNKNVQPNGLYAKKIRSVFLLFKIAKRNVEPRLLVGSFVFQAKVVNLLSMLQSVPQQTIAFDLNRLIINKDAYQFYDSMIEFLLATLFKKNLLLLNGSSYIMFYCDYFRFFPDRLCPTYLLSNLVYLFYWAFISL